MRTLATVFVTVFATIAVLAGLIALAVRFDDELGISSDQQLQDAIDFAPVSDTPSITPLQTTAARRTTPMPEIWIEKVREIEAQESVFGFFAIPAGMGTAFYIDDTGTLLTAAHIVQERGPYLLERFGGADLYRVSIVAADKRRDLALLIPDVPFTRAIGREGGVFLVFELSDRPPAIGEEVWILCASPAEDARLIPAKVTRIHALEEVGTGLDAFFLNDAIILDEEAHAGCSGAPVVNGRGIAIGLVHGGGNGITVASSGAAILAWTDDE